MGTTRKRRSPGQGSVYRRGRSPFWYIRYRDGRGRRVTESSRSKVKADAEALLLDRRHSASQGESRSPGRLTFDDMHRDMLYDREIRGCRSKPSVGRLVKAFGGWRATAIDRPAIVAYERKRLIDDGASRATVNQELASLRRMFNVAIENGLLNESQKPRIKTPNPKNARQGFFEEEDFFAMVAALPKHLVGPIRFGYYTGWRVRSEVLPLRWSQVDFESGMVRLEPNTTKNNEGREFPFSALPDLAELLESQRTLTRSLEMETSQIIPWVFHRKGQRIRSYRWGWEKAREDAAKARGPLARGDLADRLVHDLRRTAVRNLERAGVPRSVAMRLTGHKTEAVYRRYAIVAKSDLEEGVAKLAKLHGGRATG